LVKDKDGNLIINVEFVDKIIVNFMNKKEDYHTYQPGITIFKNILDSLSDDYFSDLNKQIL
jgi:hypothetical protein